MAAIADLPFGKSNLPRAPRMPSAAALRLIANDFSKSYDTKFGSTTQ